MEKITFTKKYVVNYGDEFTQNAIKEGNNKAELIKFARSYYLEKGNQITVEDTKNEGCSGFDYNIYYSRKGE